MTVYKKSKQISANVALYMLAVRANNGFANKLTKNVAAVIISNDSYFNPNNVELSWLSVFWARPKHEAEIFHFDAHLKNNGKEKGEKKKERKKYTAKIFTHPLADVELELICQQRRWMASWGSVLGLWWSCCCEDSAGSWPRRKWKQHPSPHKL